jgi:DNA polymerase-3 subunit alpha
MSEEEAKAVWGLCITSGSYAFNYAHCVSYSMLGYWSQWFRVHQPEAFYAAALAKMPRGQTSGMGGKIKVDRHTNLMRDARLRDIQIQPPSIKRSGVTWERGKPGRIRAGFSQVPGIGDKMANQIVTARDAAGFTRWSQLMGIKGIGPKTYEKIEEFATSDDPFGLDTLDLLLSTSKTAIRRLALPYPTHTSEQVPYERGENTKVVWLGIGLHRNLRDIYEINRARTGVELDPEQVKDPHLNEWMILTGTDGSEIVSFYINRWSYPRMKDALWGLELGTDPILIMGTKPGYRNARAVNVHRFWVLDLED